MSGSEGSDAEVNDNRRDHNDGGSGSEDGGGGRGGGGRGGRGEELATKALTIQSKRFYLDVKQNDRGRFIKFAEVAGGGRKSRVFMSMRTANTFKDLLSVFIEKGGGESGGAKGGSKSPKKDEKAGGGGMIHSETLVADKRRYFFDLRENNRGRFLRITQSSLMDGTRFSIALPAEGLKQLDEVLVEIIEEYGAGYMDDPPQVELPESRNMRAENKYFYFDPGHNDRGDFLKISEVKPAIGGRQTITVSLRSLPHFVDILNDLMSKIQDMRAAGGGGAVSTEVQGNKAEK